MKNPKLTTGALRTLLRRCRMGAVAFLSAVLAGAVGVAAAQSTRDIEADPPGRVGRISDVIGQVQLYHPNAGEWANADRNRPVTGGDRLATEGSGRAELRIGSTTVRLDGATELEVLRIDDTRIELQLHAGTVSVRLRSREAVGEFELLTGEGRFRAQRTGRYRIDRIDEASHLTVNSGTMIFEGPGSALTVYSGQRAEFWLDGGNAAQYALTEPKRDSFAAWNSERDRNDDRSASTRYVSPEMTGVEDLDRYGRWESSDEYGPLWIPRAVAVGWAPYSSGHWAWVHPWGWTWVDDAPWGFAPFHYGRWVWHRSNWYWAPGTRVLRPVYAPALVAWVGGPHVSVSVNLGGPTVGWFPLAPREVYVPTYRVSPRYVREVNITHVTSINNVTQIINNGQRVVEQRDFSNRKFPHAVTVVPASVMTQRQPVAPAAAQWRERHDSGNTIREVTRGTALAVAPVQAPPARIRAVESQLITAPGVGNAGRPASPPQGPGARNDERQDGERRGLPRAPGAPSPVAPVIGGQRPPMLANPAPNAPPAATPAAPAPVAPAPVAPAVISGSNRPMPNVAPAPAPNPAINPGANNVPPAPRAAAPVNPAPPAATPPRSAAPPAVAAVQSIIVPRPDSAGQPGPNAAPPAPAVRTPGNDPRNRPQRPTENNSPAQQGRQAPPPAQAGPVRGHPAEQPGRNRGPAEVRAVPPAKGQVAERQVRERAEQRGQDMRRDGRDRPQAN